MTAPYSFAGDENGDGGRRGGAEEDIYGDLDEDVARIRECHNDNGRNNPHTASSDDEENPEEAGELLLFSYFCDHFA